MAVDDQCKREHHNKEENIIAQEVGELLGMALTNYAASKPSLKSPDEVLSFISVVVDYLGLFDVLPSYLFPSFQCRRFTRVY
jgi:hypothetical protein